MCCKIIFIISGGPLNPMFIEIGMVFGIIFGTMGGIDVGGPLVDNCAKGSEAG